MKGISAQQALFAATLVASWASLTGPANAQTICVTCDGPMAVYSCSLAPGSGGGVNRRRLQYRCIEDIAQRYGHATCSVRRRQVSSCVGQVHMVAPAPAVRSDAAAARQGSPGTAEQPHPGEVKQPQRRRSKEPKTVIELAKKTARQTSKGIKKSAKKVSKAARSTWRCVYTLFSDC